MLGYSIEQTLDDNATLLVTCTHLPEVTTFAESEAEARVRAKDAIEEALAGRIADGDDVPAPTSDRIVAPLPALTLAKVELYRALRAEGLSIAELAVRLGIQATSASHLLDLNHRTAMPRFDAAFGALGHRLGIEVSVAT